MEKKTQKRKDRRVEMSVEGLKDDFAWHLRYSLAKGDTRATERDEYTAFAMAVRDRLVERWISTQEEYARQNTKRVYYMSLEFLIGRLLGNNVINLKADQLCREALKEYGIDWNSLRDYESDAGLGNGGLGRLAACYIDSMSTLNLAGMGYGLRYDYGIFRQKIVNGCQVEEPDHWLKNGYPWEMARPEYAQHVHFGGHVECRTDGGKQQWYWVPAETVEGVPYDLPIVGYDKAVNSLRLWSAKAVDDFDLANFDKGSYVEAVEQKVLAENLTKVLYPNDNTMQGKELRLRQQYFFVACSLRDILRRFRQTNDNWEALPDKVFIQLNDTHPTLVVPELMRILIDLEGLDWDKAWDLTRRSTGYTNHTILQEALEKWPVPMMERLLPRHLQIIYEINGRFLQEISSLYPGDIKKLQRMSLIDENGERYVRMANLCVVGTSSVNGVAELHTEILKKTLFKDFYELWPEKFHNVTNGITPRRWLLKANPSLSQLISESIGDSWITHLDDLKKLEKFADDSNFLSAMAKIKRSNKGQLANWTKKNLGIELNPDAIFDVQVKRLHEYKRQLMLALYIVMFYNRLLGDKSYDPVPRQFIFAAKAAPGYYMAKLIIRFEDEGQAICRVSPRLSRFACREDHAGLRGFRADISRGHGGVWNGQHEVHDERCADSGHLRRRERRDPPRGGRREHVPLRPQDRGRGEAPPDLRLEGLVREGPRDQAGARHDQGERLLASRAGALRADSPLAPRLQRLLHASRRPSLLQRGAGPCRRRVPRREKVEPHVARQRRAFGLLLVRPLRDGVRSRHLAREPRQALRELRSSLRPSPRWISGAAIVFSAATTHAGMSAFRRNS